MAVVGVNGVIMVVVGVNGGDYGSCSSEWWTDTSCNQLGEEMRQ